MNHLSILQAIVLGVVEGITEFLPISSTGHLIITASLLGLDAPPERKAAVAAFNIIVQGGAILAVLGLYRDRVQQMLRGLFAGDRVGLTLVRNLVVSFMPAVVLGVLFDDLIEARLFHAGPVVAALALGGIAMLVIGPWQRRRLIGSAQALDGDSQFLPLEQLGWHHAAIIGLLQCVAMWPGTSRSMMTMLAGMLVGLRPRQAAEYSFLLGLPTLGGACLYKLAKNFTGSAPNLFEVLGVVAPLVGVVAATVSAIVAVKWLVGYLEKNDFAIFGWYRLALSVVVAIMIWQGVLTIVP
ncbi:MAG: undecaprenyl-diphosphate phosphatase [Planctomycetota bacterium]|nr:undecaprenyl-diphosphate phosphatase [Planctomycetota bacterium]MDA1179537.1 undecaprenyl-diphosphate phosphatase [Planctomycetota bacterium]